MNLKLPSQVEPKSAEVPLDRWVQQICDAPHERFRTDATGMIWDGDECIARMTKGIDLLRPDVSLLISDELDGGAKLRITRRLIAYARDLVSALFAPAHTARYAELSGYARGLVYQVESSLGSILAASAHDQISQLSVEDREALAQLDLVVGEKVAYLSSSLKPSSVSVRMALSRAFFGASMPSISASTVQFACADYPSQLTSAVGFPRVGKMAIRADVLERVHRRLSCSQSDQQAAIRDVSRWLGCKSRQSLEVAVALGLGKSFAARDPRECAASQCRQRNSGQPRM